MKLPVSVTCDTTDDGVPYLVVIPKTDAAHERLSKTFGPTQAQQLMDRIRGLLRDEP